MYYPKADFCPLNDDEIICTPSVECNSEETLARSDMETCPKPNAQTEMMKKIQEIGFAVVDLNLFLDTHPDCAQALELYTMLASTLKSLKTDYVSKYGPLCATDSRNSAPFEWVKDTNKWPWEV